MSDRTIASYLLYERANKILNFETLHPRDVVETVKTSYVIKVVRVEVIMK